MLQFLVFLLSIMSSLNAYSGWTSGGGELFGDSGNPWFIQNTLKVRYCVQIDPQFFHLEKTEAEAHIENAFKYWKSEFKYAHWFEQNDSQSIKSGATMPLARLKVATQDFIKTDCSENPEIVFQLGFLTSDQLKKIQNYNSFAAFSVRTEYDIKNLSGKGFIYFAPETGHSKTKEMAENTWNQENGIKFYQVLIHELGHVFGLSHSVKSGKASVMSDSFVEKTVSNSQNSPDLSNDELWPGPFFTVRPSFYSSYGMACGAKDSRFEVKRKFFGIDPSWPACFGVKLGNKEIKIYGMKNINDSQKTLIGTARFENSVGQIKDAIGLFLPVGQEVFANSPALVPGFNIEDQKAIYNSADHQIERKMFLTLDPTKNDPLGDDLKIGGIMDDLLYINLIEGL